MAYNPYEWIDGEIITADKLNHIEYGIGSNSEDIEALRGAYGTPLVASTAADMKDTNKIYVYVGDESGYTNGHWYYYDGTAWADGGAYNATALVTDTTLSIAGEAADAKATGDAVDDLNNDLKTFTGNSRITGWVDGKYIATNGSTANPSSPTSSAAWRYVIVYCSAGDKFTVNGTGRGTPRLWAFIDSNNNILEAAGSNAVGSGLVITAPVSATALIINDTSKTADSYKGVILKDTVNNIEAGFSPIKNFRNSQLNAFLLADLYTYNGVAYQPQSICYDSNNAKYYICGGSKTKDGSAILIALSDLTDISNSEKYVIQTGHSNDIAYDANLDRLVVVTGSLGGTQEGSVDINTVSFIIPSTGVIESQKVVVPQQDENLNGICINGNDYYLRTSNSIYKTNSSLTNFYKVADLNASTISGLTGFSENNIGVQGIFCDNDRIYTVFYISEDLPNSSGTTSLKRYAGICETVISSGKMYVHLFPTCNAQEVEGGIIVNNAIIMVSYSNSLSVFYRIPYGYFAESDAVTFLKPNTDLNNLYALGNYTVFNVTTAGTILHTPDINSRTFNLEVNSISGTFIHQKLTTITNLVFERTYNLSNASWTEWTAM